LRLATGNSLVGARREVFKTEDVTRKGTKDKPNWLGLVPEAVPLYHGPDGPLLDEHWTAPPRPKGTIYHFLLPAEGMAAFDKDKVIRGLAPKQVEHIKQWRKDFYQPFNRLEAERLEKISDAVDRLFAQVVRERTLATNETSDRIPVWGEANGVQSSDLLVRDQEEVAASLEHKSSAYQRLKLAMDAWCALWFWPIEQARLLPNRATWLAQMELVLCGQVTYEPAWEQQKLFSELLTNQATLELPDQVPGAYQAPLQGPADRLKRLQGLSDAFRERRADYLKECGLADIDAVLDGETSLRATQGIVDRLHFHHWALRFAEVFAWRGGFDLILGNPPWVKLTWQESGVLSDYNATIETRKISASETAKLRDAVLEDGSARGAYLEEFTSLGGMQEYLNAVQNYALLNKVQANLYKCFITRAWENGNEEGVSGFLHPVGTFDDPKGGTMRRTAYLRLAAHYRFANEEPLFPDVGHQMKFSLNVYASESDTADFDLISNLIHPRTIDACWAHDGLGPTPGIKDDEDRFCSMGHRNRIVHIGSQRLALFASLYDEPGTLAIEARLPVVHSEEIARVLERFGEQPRKLRDLSDEYFATEMWHETNAQKDGTIRRATDYAASASDWIFQGPHFHVANPLSKTPNEDCRSKGDYTPIDLTAIDSDYLPRTNYLPACGSAEYFRRTPEWKGRPTTDFYRHLHRTLSNPIAERTLISCLIPPGPAHVNAATTITFSDVESLLTTAGMTASLPADFFVRSTGSSGIWASLLARLPLCSDATISKALKWRTLRLNCLTDCYRDLWEEQSDTCDHESPTSEDPRVGNSDVSAAWTVRAGLRSDLERRQALLEIDVLASMALGLATDELLTIYRVQFPVLQQYERERLYDQNGRIVSTSKSAAGNPAVSLVELAATLKEQAGFDLNAEYHPDGSNTQEFRKQKIRLGKKEADVLGVSERCTMADLLAETEVRWSDEDHPEGRPVRLVGLRYTDPGLEPRMERVYPTPWTRCDREADYRQAWAEFERRLGKKMPEGTAL